MACTEIEFWSETMGVVLTAYNQGRPISQGTLDGSGKLIWSSSISQWWNSCDGLEFRGAIFESVWLVVTDVVLDGKGFPKFNVVTPFFVCSIFQSQWVSATSSWTLAANILLKTVYLQFPDSSGNPPSMTFSPDPSHPIPNGFQSAPPSLGVSMTSTADITLKFVTYPNTSSWVLQLSTQVDGGGDFWNPFPVAGDAYSVTFSYRVFSPTTAPNLAVTPPQPYLEISGFNPAKLATFWTYSIAAPYLVSVRSAEPDVPLSTAMTLAPLAGGAAAPMWFYRAVVDISSKNDGTRTVVWHQGCFSTEGSCEFYAQDFLVHDGSPFKLGATVSRVFLEDLPFRQSGTGSVAIVVFNFDQVTVDAVQSVRLGALDLSFPQQTTTQSSSSLAYMAGYLELSPGYTPTPMYIPRASVQNLQMYVNVQVGSQDPLSAVDTSSNPEPPIVISSGAAADQPQYSLLISESNLPPQQTGQIVSRTLSLQLQQPEDDGGPVSLFVLDCTPFLVARVNLPSLLGGGVTDTSVVAEWNNTFSGGAVWQTQSGAQIVNLLLPPQGVGEQMERYKDDIQDTALPIDYRFSPPAALQITPPVLEGNAQTYFEAPWNLRRLLSTPGQELPGVSMPTFTSEFLYGMPVSVQSTQLRLAEISALTGAIAGQIDLPQQTRNALLVHANQWQTILDLFESRLSALIPWDGVHTGSLELTDGTQYSLRPSADLAYPALDAPPLGPVPYPNRDVSKGLKGGVNWIFESQSDFGQLWQRPQSTSAILADPAFSALGGWATQKAIFQDGLITIKAHVEMGRVSTMSLELLGRVGVLWNKAKHVTVFSRTVEPAPQFTAEQDPLLGRPIVRKVQEYIEILEPVRQYPESPSGAINVAFVQGSEFKSKIIYIDGSWEVDLPEGSGSIVPLWKPSADPSLYPKPHITLQVAVDPDTGVSTQSQELDEPEKLVFYRYTGANADPDPNKWGAALGVDFADVDTTVANNQGYRLSTIPGCGAFTWALRTSHFATNLTAARTSSAMSANLKNVTMMRSPTKAIAPAPPTPLQKLQRAHDLANSLMQEVSDNASLKDFSTVLGGSDLSTYFQSLPQQASDAFSAVSIDIQKLKAAASANVQSLTANADGLYAGVISQLTTAVQTGDANLVSTAQALARSLDAPLAGMQLDTGAIWSAVNSQLTTLNSQANLFVPKITTAANSGDLATALTLLKQLQPTIIEALQPLAGQLSQLQTLASVQFSAGWLPLATLESRLAQPISDLVDRPSGKTDSAVATEILAALPLLTGDINALQSVADAIKAAPLALLTLDPVAAKLANVASADDVKKWLTDAGNASVQTAIAQVQSDLGTWLDSNSSAWVPATAAAASIQDSINAMTGNLQYLIQTREALGSELSAFVPNLTNQVQSSISGFLAAGTLWANDLTSSAIQPVDSTLNLLRAFGVPPIAPGLDFSLLPTAEITVPNSLQNLAYFFDSSLPNVPINSNVQSLLAEAAQAVPGINPINLNVPVSALLDRLVPDPQVLLNTAISNLFPNLAGMNLSSLFQGLLPPLNAPDGITIRHSVNPQTLQVEVDAQIDIPFASDATVLSEGPILLRLLKPRFQATVTFNEKVGNTPVVQVNGSISGDWEVQIAGLSLVTFVSTSLTFDSNGHIHFNVSPEKVRLASVMQFIADLVNSLMPSGSGLSISFSTDPIAVVTNLDLPLPDIAAGTFAISNIRLGALFSIGLTSDNSFEFIVGMNLSRMDAPFAIVIFILGGGGWVEAQLNYVIGAKPIVTAEIGISAVASLEIALGPISGGVMISFSLFASYDSSASSSLDLGIVIVVAGHVSLLSIVDADITLLLEAYYSSGSGKLTGRGSVSVDIHICWCFTLSIHQEVEYAFGNSGGGNASQNSAPAVAAVAAHAVLNAAAATAPDNFSQAASDYIDMLAA